MIKVLGSSALSDFRATQLLKKLKSIEPSVTSVSAQFEHFIDSAKLSPDESKKVENLLDYGSPADTKTSDNSFVIVPRLGTISPWSSKATDIFKNSGIASVNRVERGVRYYISSKKTLDDKTLLALAAVSHDPMIEVALTGKQESKLENLFKQAKPKPISFVPIQKNGIEALEVLNSELGLAFSSDEMEYLASTFTKLGRDPTDAEIMMFSLVNSEHCRHKVFNAKWDIDGESKSKSLFSMIKNTYEKNSEGIKSAYHDNGAVLSGHKGDFFTPNDEGVYHHHKEAADIVIKVETHNHPTAIAPIPGAATGSGGEIRDEGATGRGAKPKAGLTGFSVSNLRIPNALQPWETIDRSAPHLASALDIMLEGPIGGAAFNNEFGRPNILGYFRSFEQEVDEIVRGYHKPVMLAGGLGNIRSKYVDKHSIKSGDQLIILGGPAMLIGLAGGSAASKEIGADNSELDFASVQRHNPEMERRAQEVINHCVAATRNPIVSIHDIGAGGYSNAVSEIVHDHGLGADVDLRAINNADRAMSPMEIWSNESQERYVVAVKSEDLKQFTDYCDRERCPYAVIGQATANEHLTVRDSELKTNVIDASMETFFGRPPKMERNYTTKTPKLQRLNLDNVKLDEAIKRVFQLPTVGSKSFLITIGDRSVGGMITRDQMVGPWQVPVADVAVTVNSFDGFHGEAMAIGERAPLALINPASSGRMAIGELITNAAAASIEQLSDIKLSGNWMAAVGTPSGDQALYETVQAVGEEFCPALGLTIPVGKDSTSMKAQWGDTAVISPLTVTMTGFAPVDDVRTTLTPQLQNIPDTVLVAIPLSDKKRLGGSALAQVYEQLGNEGPDADADRIKDFFEKITRLKKQNKILAYHDRSDGGLITTLCEMAFAGRIGLDINFKSDYVLAELFNEELGVVVQVKDQDASLVLQQFESAFRVAKPSSKGSITITNKKSIIFNQKRNVLEEWWTHTSHQLASLRDNPESAKSEFNLISDKDSGISPHLTYDITNNRTRDDEKRPKVAILREQGVNGQIEMAAAFDRAGFEVIDVHMSDLLSGKKNLEQFTGLAACGGFSYGDVLGAGNGWAKSILQNDKLREQFKIFFERSDTFSLGVCNGCQMLAGLKEIIPGSENWPSFKRNTSEQFEARLSTVAITDSPSILLKDMAGSLIPVPVAHGEGRTVFDKSSSVDALTCMKFVDNNGKPTQTYPLNPNGSFDGITALTTTDGRVTIMMPHPERAFRNVQLTWKPDNWVGEDSPWMKIFDNAYAWSITQ